MFFCSLGLRTDKKTEIESQFFLRKCHKIVMKIRLILPDTL